MSFRTRASALLAIALALGLGFLGCSSSTVSVQQPIRVSAVCDFMEALVARSEKYAQQAPALSKPTPEVRKEREEQELIDTKADAATLQEYAFKLSPAELNAMARTWATLFWCADLRACVAPMNADQVCHILKFLSSDRAYDELLRIACYGKRNDANGALFLLIGVAPAMDQGPTYAAIAKREDLLAERRETARWRYAFSVLPPSFREVVTSLWDSGRMVEIAEQKSDGWLAALQKCEGDFLSFRTGLTDSLCQNERIRARICLAHVARGEEPTVVLMPYKGPARDELAVIGELSKRKRRPQTIQR